MSLFKITPTPIDGLLLIEPKLKGDKNPLLEGMLSEKILAQLSQESPFVEEQRYQYRRGVLCGLHFQPKHYQAKLVGVTAGRIMDVAVDLRAGSRTYGASHSVLMTPENGRMLYIPPRFAHGFLTLENDTEVVCKYSVEHDPNGELGIIYDDQILMIDWQFERHEIDEKRIILSPRDKKAAYFRLYNPNALWEKKRKPLIRY